MPRPSPLGVRLNLYVSTNCRQRHCAKALVQKMLQTQLRFLFISSTHLENTLFNVTFCIIYNIF